MGLLREDSLRILVENLILLLGRDVCGIHLC